MAQLAPPPPAHPEPPPPLRLIDPGEVLTHGLALSALAAAMTGFAGWHGGKLVFDHGVGVLVSEKS